MNVDAYLARIGLAQRPAPTLAGLTALHRAHLLAVPFENLDVQLGNPLGTAIAPIYDKIVTRHRGGWCYEMNGVFGWALGELGFRVHRATGAVMRETMGAFVIGNHLVLRVDLDEGTWLADVGFGDGPRDPVALREGPFEAAGFAYDLKRLDDQWWRLSNPRGGSFDFNLAPADESLLAEKCRFLQTAAMSPFVQNMVAQRHTPEGITILRGRVLTQVTPQSARESLITDADEFVRILKDTFALDLPEAASLWPKIMARHQALFPASA